MNSHLFILVGKVNTYIKIYTKNILSLTAQRNIIIVIKSFAEAYFQRTND